MSDRLRPSGMVVLAAVSTSLGAGAYNYEDIIPQYCHVSKDWGRLPAKPAGATELIQVQAFIRHGARTLSSDDYCWNGDDVGNWTCKLNYLDNSISGTEPLTPDFRTEYLPGRNAIAGNCMTGQLVEDGFEMEQNNGRRLREAYIEREGFLPPTLTDLDVAGAEALLSFRSTDVPRTRQSGMALFSGLYPASSMGTLPYMPLKTMDFKQENMLVNAKVCPATAVATDEFFEGLPTKDQLMAQCKQLKPSQAFAKTSECFWYLQHVIDCLMSRMCPTVPFSPHNSTVPEYFMAEGEQSFKTLWKLVDEAQWGYFKAMAKVGGMGSFANDYYSAVLQAVDASRGAAATEAPKFMLWSGHDTGPMEPIYAALNLRPEPPYWPAFASMLVLELWKSDLGIVARWLSNGKVVAGPMPLDEFQDKVSAVVNSRKACQADAGSAGSAGSAPAPDVASGFRRAAAGWSVEAVAVVSAAGGVLATLGILGACKARMFRKEGRGFEDPNSRMS
eukprot:CAMPEP_0177260542 /NCGR_PEP_ID=MMETSP0367-20130122/59316_1 /TAXON_ID=447022 ORGANISM="Scrippsiella hangoei-like, Strain SHHI-4" /NCGR_SAMPLE_ID=MMETSP0367 /ASSEMBLY_ACC=CAM_ASM_000362 /LENGTH=502 /DNA_ID=CAMNT_0018715071 /DNA_START=28 /DNA_END=1536 /DNA_ORIENTATION=+